MNSVGGDGRPRSSDRFEQENLDFLVRAALADNAAFETRYPRYLGLSGRLICIALAQGAARHLVEGWGGVHDFDVWSFFRAEPGCPAFPPRRRMTASFEGPRFQQSSRRIDLLGRSMGQVGDARLSVISYLEAGRTVTARALSECPVFILHPADAGGAIPAVCPKKTG